MVSEYYAVMSVFDHDNDDDVAVVVVASRLFLCLLDLAAGSASVDDGDQEVITWRTN